MANHPNRSRKYYVHCTRYHMKSQTHRDTYGIIEAEADGSVPAGVTHAANNPRNSWTSSNQGPLTKSEAETRLAELIADRNAAVAASKRG